MTTRGLLLVVMAAATAGCAGNDVLLQKQAETESRVENVIQGTKENASRLGELAATIKELRSKIESQEVEIAALRAGMRDRTSLSRTEPEVKGTPRIEVVNAETAEKQPAAAEAYLKAFGLYSANNFTEAIVAFTEVIRLYPESDYAGNAQYWIGECYYTQANFPKALDAFETTVSRFPNGKKLADAKLKIGFTLYAMKEPEKGRAVLEELISTYPDNPHIVAKAKERINRHP